MKLNILQLCLVLDTMQMKCILLRAVAAIWKKFLLLGDFFEMEVYLMKILKFAKSFCATLFLKIRYGGACKIPWINSLKGHIDISIGKCNFDRDAISNIKWRIAYKSV